MKVLTEELLETSRKNPKKTYAQPILTTYGTVQQLTQAVGRNGNRDNGFFPRRRRTSV